jgi:tryptophan synthase alpha chain
MSRIQSKFAELKSAGRKALVPYVIAGFPFADSTPELMHAMVAAGADVIELGVPFSDPMADGPVIQKAGEQALAFGVGTAQVLAMVRSFRERDGETPVVLMGYANPVERYDLKHGKDGFVRDAAAAGVDGVLIVDYPPEECEDFAAKLRAAGLDLLKGVTGAANIDIGEVAARIAAIRQHVKLPIGVGFGIRDAATARAVGKSADAVIIGSRIIQLLDGQPREQGIAAVADFLRGIRSALDA